MLFEKFRRFFLLSNIFIPNTGYVVGRQGFEPWKPMAADLQSAPVVHLGTCPF